MALGGTATASDGWRGNRVPREIIVLIPSTGLDKDFILTWSYLERFHRGACDYQAKTGVRFQSPERRENVARSSPFKPEKRLGDSRIRARTDQIARAYILQLEREVTVVDEGSA